MYHLTIGRVISKFNRSVLVQRSFSSLYSNHILVIYIVYELNNWLCNPADNFPLKRCLLVTVKVARNAVKIKFNYNGPGMAFDEEGF